MAKKKSDIETQFELFQRAQASLKDYNDVLKETRALNENILYVEGEVAKLIAEKKDLENQLTAAKAAGNKKLIASLDKQIATKEHGIALAEEELELGRKKLDLQKNVLKQVELKNLRIKEGINLTKRLGHYVLKQKDYWLEQQKGVKETELSMGILSNQATGFRKNIYQTAISTTQIGVNTKELAKLQGTYSDNVGRAVQLNESQLQAVAEIGKGTILGTEAAAELAANFELIGIGAEGTKDFIDESLELATKMGTSSSKTIKNIEKNFRLLNKYNFQGGVEGFGKMAALATKFKFEMESIAGFADDLMTPEGAVEVASKLQVLGGEWAKLGDPFELMYKSRNDVKGLTEDIINATKATATFDESTGEFRISPMELNRLREVAAVTGLNAEELAQMAKQSAKFDKIKTLIPNTFSDEDKDYLSSLATFDKKTGKYQVTLQTQDETLTENIDDLKDITPEMIKVQKAYTQTLEERAKQSLTFQERFNNITETLQSAFLPAFEAVAKVLERAVTWLEPIVEDIANWIEGLPDAVVGALGAGVAGLAILGDKLLWIQRGMWLGTGFKGVAGGGGGGLGDLFGGGKGKLGKMGKGGLLKDGLFNLGKNGAVPFAKGGGKLGFLGRAGRAAGSVGAIGGGLLSAGISGYDEWTENKEAGMDTGENVGRTALRGGGAGLGAWGGAAAGAAIGSAVPVIGTIIGGLIGGALGAWGGGALGDWGGDAAYGKGQTGPKMDDFIMRPNEDATRFSSQDTLVGAKNGGPLDRMISAFHTKEMPDVNVPENNVSIDLSEALIGEKSIEAFNKIVNSLEAKDEIQEIPFDSFTKRIRNVVSQDTGQGNVNFDELISKFQSREETNVPYDSFTKGLRGIGSELIGGNNIDFDKIINAFQTKEQLDVVTETPSVSIDLNDSLIGSKNTLEYDKISEALNLTKIPEATPGNNTSSSYNNASLDVIEEIGQFQKMIEAKTPENTSSSGVEVRFKDTIKIEGKIDVTSGDQIREIDLNDPILMQNLSRIIREQLSKAVGGGKISSNPVSM